MGGRCCLVTGRVFIIVSWCRGEVGYFLLVGAGLPYSRLPDSGVLSPEQRPCYFSSAGSAPFFVLTGSLVLSSLFNHLYSW